jgi:hypothetical protein
MQNIHTFGFLGTAGASMAKGLEEGKVYELLPIH